jgi:hypothetical protein
MANIGLRAMMLDATYPFGAQVPKALRLPFQPFSNARPHWVGIDQARTLSAMSTIASAAPIPELRDLIAVLLRLDSKAEWRALIDQRGEDYHRWRLESPPVRGINRSSMWQTAPGVRTFTPSLEYVDGAHIVQDVVDTTGAAIPVLVAHMAAFREQWRACLQPLSGGA